MRNLRPYMSIFGIRYPVSSDLRKIILGPRTVAGLLFKSLSFRSMNLVLFNLFSLGDAIVFSNNGYVNFLFPDFAGNILKLPRTDWECSFVTSKFFIRWTNAVQFLSGIRGRKFEFCLSFERSEFSFLNFSVESETLHVNFWNQIYSLLRFKIITFDFSRRLLIELFE